jgi:hypothetical protein
MFHLDLTKQLWKDFLRPNDLVVDATCGGGRDTLFLSRCVSEGRVYGFDVQEEAIGRTRALLEKEGVLDRVILQKCCHSVFPPFPSPPRLVVYNLGYLPGGNKRKTTMTSTTLQSVENALSIGAEAISITCYPGHEEGAIEEKALLEWAQKLPSNQWRVSHHRALNRLAAPSVLWIQAGREPTRSPTNSPD